MSTVQVKTDLPFPELLHAVEQLNQFDLEQLMTRIITLRANRQAPALSKEETDLLLRINQGIPLVIQTRFDQLVAKRRAESLTPDEHQELLHLVNQIEKSDAERIRELTKLAQLRGVTLTTLMDQLGIQPPPYSYLAVESRRCSKFA